VAEPRAAKPVVAKRGAGEPAAAAREVDRPADEVADSPPREHKKKKPDRTGDDNSDSATLRMPKVHLIPNTAVIRGRKLAILKHPETGDELGVVWETTRKVLGATKILGIGPIKFEFPRSYEVRDGDKAGPALVRIRIDKPSFRFELGAAEAWRPVKYVVSTADGDIGTFVVSRNPLKPDNRILDADGQRVGEMVWELKIGRRVVLLDRDRNEFGHVIGERSLEHAEMVEEAKQGRGKIKVEVHTIFNPDKRGSYAVVHPDRVGDRWAHAMVLAFGALVQGAGLFAMQAGAKDTF
jgi:hypothetical protein